MARNRTVAMEGGCTPLPEGAERLGPADDDEQLEVTVTLHPGEDFHQQLHPYIHRQVRRLPRAEFARHHRAPRELLRQVARFAESSGLEVRQVKRVAHSVVLAGSARRLGRAFGVELERHDLDGQTFLAPTGPVRLPGDLGPIVQGVFGLDTRPLVSRRSFPAATLDTPVEPTDRPPYPVPEVATEYGFPLYETGHGRRIVLLEFGGGYEQELLDQYFQAILGRPGPQILDNLTAAERQQKSQGRGEGHREVMLDIEVVGAVVPDCTLFVMFYPNHHRSWAQAIHDSVFNLPDGGPPPDAISISWAASENEWTDDLRHQVDLQLARAAAQRVTVLASSGDGGVTNGPERQVNYPAVSPWVLACGGTRLEMASDVEVVWNNDDRKGTGGGISSKYDVPSWQQGLPPGSLQSLNDGAGTGRGIPDVAGLADPDTGYQLLVRGKRHPDKILWIGEGGTSAVAPLWAGLIAQINAITGERQGFLNQALYDAAGRGFRDVTDGDNSRTRLSGYSAGPGWDACTGWGSPQADELLALLGGG